jgi:serine O-acetyltransferase
MFETLRADLGRKRRAYIVRAMDQTWFNRNIKIFLQQGSIAVAVFRFGQWVQRLRIPVLKQILFAVYYVLNLAVIIFFGINIQLSATIGRGFIIHNYSGIFVGRCTLGENCIVNQGVTIGNIRGEPGRPIFGNNVYIGVSAVVLGNVKIGNNVVIGANSLVITNVPDNCTVVGVPARIVSRRPTSPYLKFGNEPAEAV